MKTKVFTFFLSNFRAVYKSASQTNEEDTLDSLLLIPTILYAQDQKSNDEDPFLQLLG